MKRPPEAYLLYFLLFFTGVNALIGGASLMIRTDGSLLGLSTAWLEGSPFPDFFIPGLLLFLLLGAFPLLILTALVTGFSLKRLRNWKLYGDTYWGWTGSLFAGIMLFTWVMVQLLLTRYFWVQPFMLAIGCLIVLITLLPRVIDFYKEKDGRPSRMQHPTSNGQG